MRRQAPLGRVLLGGSLALPGLSLVVPLPRGRYEGGAMAKRTARIQKIRVRGNRTGVDLSLVRWMVRLTPTQRLAVLQDHVNLVNAFRRAAQAD